MGTETSQFALSATGLKIGYPGRRKEASQVGGLFDLRIEPGELVCLLGPNGVGKSTLIRTLAGMQPSLGGEIRIAGMDLSQMSPRQKARSSSIVLTDPVSTGLMTAYSVVALGRHPHTGWTGSLSAEDRKKIDWALQAVDASSLADRNLAELSDGERQKVMIARALTQETSLMFLDEPTAFLDLPRRVELMRILRDLAHKDGLAILLSTHDLDIAVRSADKLWLLGDNGEFYEGLPEVLALEGLIASVFSSETLDWDETQGGFKIHRDPTTALSLEGEGVAFEWTRRLLFRLGIGLSEQGSDSLLVNSSGDGVQWTLKTGDRIQNFDQIDRLAKCLSQYLNE